MSARCVYEISVLDDITFFLEILPDQIILQVCSYLHGADVLSLLYNLNARLNVTITDYCRHVDLSDVTYQQFNLVLSHILPKIASDIRSFVFHGYRDRAFFYLTHVIHISSITKNHTKLLHL